MNFKFFSRNGKAKGNGQVKPAPITPDEQSQVEDTQTLVMKAAVNAKKYRDTATDFAEKTSADLEMPNA